MSTTVKDRKVAPPPSTARKALPINKRYEDKAKALLRYAMSQRGVSIDELTQRLNGMGVKVSSGGLANKISRGGFGSAFMLQCMDALEMELTALER